MHKSHINDFILLVKFSITDSRSKHFIKRRKYIKNFVLAKKKLKFYLKYEYLIQ